MTARVRLARGFVRVALRLPLGPPLPVSAQRAWLQVLGTFNLPRRRARREAATLNGVPGERVGTGRAAAILYAHGGGGVLGAPRQFRASFASLAAAADATVYAPAYRKAPEHPCPAATDDCEAWYEALLESGWPPERLVLAGDSAGGGIALALALRLRDAGRPLPAALALVSPHVDMTLSGETHVTRAASDPLLRRSFLDANVAAYCGGLDPADPRCSPLFGDLAGLPPLLIQSGTDDVLFSDSEQLAERARAAGVSARLDARGGGLFHAFQWFPLVLPEAEAALGEIARFVREPAPAAG